MKIPANRMKNVQKKGYASGGSITSAGVSLSIR